MTLGTSDGVAVRARVGVERWAGAGVVPLALVCCAASCGNAPPPSDYVGKTTSAIQGGTTDTTHKFAVGIVQYDDSAGLMAYCTGVLLTPNLVATARHCVQSLPIVSDAAPDEIDCSLSIFGTLFPLDSLYVTTDTTFGSKLTSVSKVIVPAGSDHIKVCGNDIALMILSKPIELPEYVVPVISPPMTSPIYEPVVTAIGYGINNPEDVHGVTAGTRRIRENVQLSCIPNDTTFTDCFSDPSAKDYLTSAEFVSGDSTCEGDSGSGAFEQSNFDQGKWVAFGVLSRGGVANKTTCDQPIYTRFDAWGPLIIDAAQQAASAASAEDAGYTLPSWASSTADDGGDFIVEDAETTTTVATAGASGSGGCALAIPGRLGGIPGGSAGLLAGLGLGIATVRRRRQRAQAPTSRP
jgi:secreted trypsin-like serine protease